MNNLLVGNCIKIGVIDAEQGNRRLGSIEPIVAFRTNSVTFLADLFFQYDKNGEVSTKR